MVQTRRKYLNSIVTLLLTAASNHARSNCNHEINAAISILDKFDGLCNFELILLVSRNPSNLTLENRDVLPW